MGRIVRSTSFFKLVDSVFRLNNIISNKGAVVSHLVSSLGDFLQCDIREKDHTDVNYS